MDFSLNKGEDIEMSAPIKNYLANMLFLILSFKSLRFFTNSSNETDSP